MKNMILISLLLCGSSSIALAEKAPAHAGHAGHSCGQMISAKAALPKKMAEVMTSVADMMDAHAAIMTASKTKEASLEVAGLKKIAADHRALAESFQKTADDMSKASSWPNAPHDMNAMKSDPKLGAAMQKMLAAEKDMIALLQKEVADTEAMGAKK
jgi:hypothetical protein